jgi:hypothetical protein
LIIIQKRSSQRLSHVKVKSRRRGRRRRRGGRRRIKFFKWISKWYVIACFFLLLNSRFAILPLCFLLWLVLVGWTAA